MRVSKCASWVGGSKFPPQIARTEGTSAIARTPCGGDLGRGICAERRGGAARKHGAEGRGGARPSYPLVVLK